MTAHELARILISGPDLPIATHANNHDCFQDGRIVVAVMRSNYAGGGYGLSVGIGNYSKTYNQCPNHALMEFVNRSPDADG